MKKLLLGIIKLLVFVVISSLALTAFLAMCYMVPLDDENYRVSIEELAQEGWYTNVLELRPGYAENFHSSEPGIQSTFDDMLIFAHTKGGSDNNPLFNAVAMGADDVLEDPESDYRYWHGYAGVLRILLLGFDCKEIKFLSFIIQLLLAFAVATLIRNKAGNELSVLFLSQYVLLMPLTVSVSVFFAFTVDISLLAILAYSFLHDRLKNPQNDCYFFCSIGILTCFFEELVFGVMSWGIVILWVILLFGKGKTTWENLLSVIASGLSWIVGYAGIWFMKWVITSAVVGINVVQIGIDSVLLRSSSSGDTEITYSLVENVLQRFNTVRMNYRYYFYTVYFLILLIWVIYIIYKLIRNTLEKDSRVSSLGLIALAPIAWYIVLSNHTIAHRFMTHRIIGFGIIAVLAIGLLSTKNLQNNVVVEETILLKNISIGKLVILTISIVLSAIIQNFIYEDFDYKNADIPGVNISISECENRKIMMTFSPSYELIESLGVSLTPVSEDGTYEIRLSDDKGVVYSNEIPMSLFAEQSWRDIPLEWKVKSGKEYCLEIIPQCKEGEEGTTSIVFPGVQAVPGLGSIMTAEKYDGAQMTCWIRYRNRVAGREWVFYFLTYFMIFVDAGLIMFNLQKKEKK